MSEPLPALEKRPFGGPASDIHLGDLRPGSILEVMDAVGSLIVIAPSPATPVMGPLPPHAQGPRQDGGGDASQSSGFAQGPARGGRVSEVSAIERETGGGE